MKTLYHFTVKMSNLRGQPLNAPRWSFLAESQDEATSRAVAWIQRIIRDPKRSRFAPSIEGIEFTHTSTLMENISHAHPPD